MAWWPSDWFSFLGNGASFAGLVLSAIGLYVSIQVLRRVEARHLVKARLPDLLERLESLSRELNALCSTTPLPEVEALEHVGVCHAVLGSARERLGDNASPDLLALIAVLAGHKSGGQITSTQVRSLVGQLSAVREQLANHLKDEGWR